MISISGLKHKKCTPCEGGVRKFDSQQVAQYLAEVTGWEERQEKIHKTFRFPDFVAAMKFINKIADVAEAEGHHPDFTVHYNIVEVTLWTHAIGGLSENDFILAAKIDALLEEPTGR